MIEQVTPRGLALRTGMAVASSALVVGGGVAAAVVLAHSSAQHAAKGHRVNAAVTASGSQWLTTQPVAVSSTDQAPEAPSIDTASASLSADAQRLASFLPGYTLAHQELMSWSAGDATEHFEFDSAVGEVDVFVNVLQQQEDVTPESDDQLVSLVTDASGTQTAVVHDGLGDHLVQIANAAGVHVKIAATTNAGQTLGDKLLQRIAQAALAQNLAR